LAKGRKSAIERRLEKLADLWNEFADDPDARLLRWLVDGDSAQMVLGFLEQQNQGAGDLPDLFMRFEVPFDDPRRYAGLLVEAFKKMYDEIRADEETRTKFSADKIPLEWACPAPRPGSSDADAFVQCCTSFRKYYEDRMVHLALILTPERIADASEWGKWLLTLVRSSVPANVRFTVVDRADAPALNELAKAEPKLITTKTPELDMAGAVKEIVRDAGVSGPGAAYQKHFIGLTEAAAKGNLPQAARLAEAALSIAREHNWPPLQVAVQMALGAAYLAAGKSADALAVYRSAGEAASAAQALGDPTGPKLLVQSRLAEGATLVNDGKYAEAAKAYEEAAPLAEQQKDHLMALESWRMAAYCHEAAKQLDPAWKCGYKALDAGALLEDKIRPNSTLPYVGQALMRLTGQRPYADKAKEVQQRMTALVGPEWEKKIAEMEKSAQ
jgi:hypothetical protein